MTQSAAVTIESTADALIVKLHGPELRDSEGDELRQNVVASDAVVATVIIDLSRVESVSTDALGDLVDILHDSQAKNRRLILAGIRSPVLETLSVTRLGKLFEYRDDVDQALRVAQTARDNQ